MLYPLIFNPKKIEVFLRWAIHHSIACHGGPTIRSSAVASALRAWQKASYSSSVSR